ncbi:E3 ubiquitin/ISG15 ligase TRIM25-like [Lethenteron reissneri]|uniref:E3 ubiquitin/ISG15 ligase TRIM25-like n=1 Tax=Lethenteron reissneri TaxID=7753 RepID=UPI002AB6A637|nr:E3 ubiquitin/ISG15 ligase TRIM25-like [Lethenteron reissneri]
MASATPAENVDRELTCTICLGTFDCPSTLSCGHSFCLQCLEDAWKETDLYCCPQCRKTFPRRPQLTRNVTIANLIEQLRVTETMVAASAAGVVFCDNCPEGNTPAVKTCLRCDTSFCTEHLVPHLKKKKFNDHVLVSPDVNPEARKCKRHKEELKFYCKQDVSLVCRDCTIAGDHTGHTFIPLEDEHRTRKSGVGEEKQAVEEKRKKAEAFMGRMEAARKDVQGSLTGVKERIKAQFSRLRTALDEDETTALHRAELKEKELLSQIDENIAHYKHEISELQAAAARLHSLQKEGDSLTFLQGHLEEARRGKVPKKSLPPALTPLDTPTIRSLERIMGRLLPLVYGRSPTLEPNSAHNNLQISSLHRTVTLTAVSQGRPDHPHRFDYWFQALCSESFSSGQHYWEVDVGGASRSCEVGVTYGTIARKGRSKECWLGRNHSSWVLYKDNNSCYVRHCGVWTSVPVRDPPQRVGCHLHWEAGLLSFYRADSMELLHSVHHSFSQPLYPALRLWNDGDSVRILDLSCAS